MGLLAQGADAYGERLTGGVSSDIWRIDLAGGPVCVKRALAKLRVAADWQAPVERNRYEARWMQRANAAVPGSAPRLLGRRRSQRRAGHAVPAARKLPALEGAAPRRRRRPGVCRPGRGHAGAHPRRHCRRSFGRRRLSHRPDLLRHPPGALPGRDRARASRPRATAARSGRRHPGQQARAGARRRQPEEHPARPGRPGVPRRRMRLVGRSRLRSRLLPQSPAAEVPVDAGRRRRLPRLLRRACRSAISRGVAWEAPHALEARAARLLPGLFLARVDGKSPVEYITTEQDRNRVRRIARALLAHPVDALGDVRQAWTKELSA